MKLKPLRNQEVIQIHCKEKYLPVRKRGNSLANDEPLSAIANETFKGSDEQDDPCRKPIRGDSGEKTKGFTDVFSDGEIVELKLGEIHERFEGVGVVGEGVVVAGNGLNPDGGDKSQPFQHRRGRRQL